MPVTITQFGGHTGSYAGDCAVVEIDGSSGKHIVIIDTGDSVIWRNRPSLARYVRALNTFQGATVTLVTTHFHRDHHNEAVISEFRFGELSAHYYSKVAAELAGFHALYKGERWNPLDKGATEFDLGAAKLTFYVPPPSAKIDDQNDQSMAVRVECEHFTYLSFGDMTKDAYLRLAECLDGHLPSATVTKYPHHGNYPNNYIDYYNRDLSASAVLISGNSGSEVRRTIASLLDNNVGAVYCLAGTSDAKQAFHDCWKTPGLPVYLSEGAVVKRGGVSIINYNATHLTTIEQSMGRRRSKMIDSWEKVTERWSDSDDELSF